VLDDVTAANKIGSVVGLFRIIKLAHETHRPFLDGLRADIGGIESNPAVSPLLTKQPEKISLSTTDFNDRFIAKVILRHERIHQPGKVLLEVRRASLGVFVCGRIIEEFRIERRVKDKSALRAERQQKIPAPELARFLGAWAGPVLVNGDASALEKEPRKWVRAKRASAHGYRPLNVSTTPYALLAKEGSCRPGSVRIEKGISIDSPPL